MEVTQIYDLMNSVTSEILGETEHPLAEDLSNVVDVGTEILNASSVDNYVRSLVNHIGRVIFVNRPYYGGVPSVLRDGWEFGSVLQKITAELPEASENESWELEDGASYDCNIFYKPEVSAKFFNKRVTFEIPRSFTEKQVKESFSNAEQLNGFLSMLYNAVDKSMTIKIDSLIMRTINTMIGETLYSEYGADAYASKSGVKAINLLYLYNQRYGLTGADALTADKALTTPEFIRFASYEMGVISSRLTKISRVFNIGGKDRFTAKDMLHVVMLTDFVKSANVFLQSDVFHNDLTALPNADEIPYWQASGSTYAFGDISKINITTPSNHVIECGGILGVMFDHDALGVANLDRRVTTHYNPKGEFFNNYYKFEAGYFCDTNENFVVFFIA